MIAPRIGSNNEVCWDSRILVSRLNDETLALNPATGLFYEFDTIGSDIVAKIARPIRVSQLCEDLLSAYEGKSEAVRGDVIRLLNDMADHGLILVSPEAI